MPKLTKTLVDKTRPGEAAIFVWDTHISGFGLRVMPSGVKSFIYQYRTPEGRTRRMTIGKYSPVLTVDQARAKAKVLSQEDDPLASKQKIRESTTVAELLADYLESAKFQSKAKTTRDTDRGRIKRHLIPTLGKKYLHKLTSDDVARAFAAIRDGKTATDEKLGFRARARVTGGEGAARTSIRLLRAILNWAIENKKLSENPASKVSIGADGQREAMLDGSEYKRVFDVLTQMENELRIPSPAADAIRLIALTGARRGEVINLRWKYVDMRNGAIVLPPQSHKAGAKTGRPRVIGLPTAAQNIIERQQKGAPDDLVFPGKGGRPMALSARMRKVREEANLPEGFSLHGLRHSIASSEAMNGASAAEIAQLLGHAQLSTSERYIHFAEKAKQKISERAAAGIASMMEGDK